MPEVKPNLVRRVLTLRQFPLFATAALDELATLAENLRPVHFHAGSVVAPAAAHVAAVQLIVHGQIESNDVTTFRERDVFGALEVAADRELLAPALATTDVDALELPSADFTELLEDNFGVLQSVLRELASRLIATAPPPAPAVPLSVGDGPLGLVERLIVLRQQLPFASARLQPLSMLAQASDDLRVAAGTVIASAGDPATAGLVVLQGQLRARRADGVLHTLGPGQHFGFVETLALAEHSYTLEAATQLRLLASPGRAMLDVIEDHSDIGVAMVAAFAAALLDSAATVTTRHN